MEITGDEEELVKIKNLVKENKVIDSLFPIPQEIMNHNPSNTSSFGNKIQKESKDNQKANCTYWMDWSLSTRGTILGDINTKFVSQVESVLVYEMFFKYSFPSISFIVISEFFPKLSFRFYNYSEEDFAMDGSIFFQDGRMIDNLFQSVDKVAKGTSRQFLRNVLNLLEQKIDGLLYEIGFNRGSSEEIPF